MSAELKETPAVYTEGEIDILEGMDAIQLRPGMYTRLDSPLHIVQEALDNAVDEALTGRATEITVTALPNNRVMVKDNGRGIPVGIHPKKNIPVIEAVYTLLHAGGKFNKTSGSSAYAFAGGLHGVGVTVTNALSELLSVTVCREGSEWKIEFSNGKVVTPLVQVGKSNKTGTEVTIQPNPKYFDSGDIPFDALKDLLKSKAVFLQNVKVSFVDKRVSPMVVEVFHYEAGLASYFEDMVSGTPVTPVIVAEKFVGEDDEQFAEGEGAIWAISWFEEESSRGQSFVNMIPTPMHGTHVTGLRAGLFQSVRTYIEHHGLLPKGVKLNADDVFKNVQYVLGAKILDPSFENQTKDRLTSRDVVKLIEKVVSSYMEPWLLRNPVQAKLIAELAIKQAQTRQKLAVKQEKRRSSSALILPGKLTDCESDIAAESELFLVEGDSAGGTAKLGRFKHNQALLPLRGKSLNTWEKTAVEAMANAEINDISTAIGIPPHTLTDTIDWSKLRYHVIAIMADADVDGFHIQILLLTLMLRHFPQLVERGHVYIACPPLYRINAEAVSKKKGPKKVYVMNEDELNLALDKLKREGYTKWTIGRFKGLGEMSAEELRDTTLNPDTRTLKRVTLPEALRPDTMAVFDNLMNKNKASWRKEWMERRGNEIHAYD